MSEKKRFPWLRILRLTLAALIGLVLGLGYNEYRKTKHELKHYKSKVQELQNTIEGFCTDTELRILSCPGKIDGCLCMPMNLNRSDFQE